MSWTDERVTLLKKLWGEGKTASEIAKVLGGVTRIVSNYPDGIHLSRTQPLKKRQQPGVWFNPHPTPIQHRPDVDVRKNKHRT